MQRQFLLYKGLQKPLIYKGFQGKFIGWGIASLVLGVVLGGLIGTLTNMLLGGFITVAILTGGLFYTIQQQKKGLHNKTRNRGVFLPQKNLRLIGHDKAEKNRL